jgi:hypothetical protein
MSLPITTIPITNPITLSKVKAPVTIFKIPATIGFHVFSINLLLLAFNIVSSKVNTQMQS